LDAVSAVVIERAEEQPEGCLLRLLGIVFKALMLPFRMLTNITRKILRRPVKPQPPKPPEPLARAAGPGVVFIEPGEHIVEALDLRRQSRSGRAKALTGDGLEVNALVNVSFGLTPPPLKTDKAKDPAPATAPKRFSWWPAHKPPAEAAEPTPAERAERNLPAYPFNPASAFQAVYGAALHGPNKQRVPWTELPAAVAQEHFRVAASEYRLDALFAPHFATQFSVEAHFVPALTRRELPLELRQIFRDHGETLTSRAEVEQPNINEPEWLIRDGPRRYVARHDVAAKLRVRRADAAFTSPAPPQFIVEDRDGRFARELRAGRLHVLLSNAFEAHSEMLTPQARVIETNVVAWEIHDGTRRYMVEVVPATLNIQRFPFDEFRRLVAERVQNDPVLRERGITVFNVVIFSFQIPPHILEQRIRSWQTPWETGKHQLESLSAAQFFETDSELRQQAQKRIIELYAKKLEGTTNIVKRQALAGSLMRSLQRVAADPITSQLLPKETLRILNYPREGWR
jgi:hypothetical protein